MTSNKAPLQRELPVPRVRQSPRDPAFFSDPYAFYARMHAGAPVFYWEDYGVLCVASFEGVDRILRDRSFGRQRPGGYLVSVAASGDRSRLRDFDSVEANSLLELEPPVHTRLRGLVNRAFVSRQVQRLRPKIEALSHRLVDAMERKGEAELIADFATPLPATIIAQMMGLPVETGPQLVAWSNDMVRMYMHAPSAEDAERANASARDFAAFIREHAAARRRRPTDDLLGVLTAAQEDGDRLTEDELVSSAILLLNAGHEATVHQVGNAVRAILAQGGDPRRFFGTDAETEATVEECFRFDTPLHMFTRQVYADVVIADGVALRPGDQVALLLGAANRDPRMFADPDVFRPDRPERKNVSFGAGIHFCIGAPLARLELQVALKVLFDRLPGLRIAEEPKLRNIYHFRGVERLSVKW